jgi:hypothetical protein
MPWCRFTHHYYHPILKILVFYVPVRRATPGPPALWRTPTGAKGLLPIIAKAAMIITKQDKFGFSTFVMRQISLTSWGYLLFVQSALPCHVFKSNGLVFHSHKLI